MDNNSDQLDSFMTEAEPVAKNPRISYLVTAVVVVLLIAVLTLIYFKFAEISNTVPVDTGAAVSEDLKETRSAITKSLMANNPEDLQELFLEDIKKGVNDQYTKAHIYFIAHRFYDNGGNIYELYDYINKYPELTFLKEAELAYPVYFAQVAEGTFPKTYTLRGNLLNMAYAEVLDKYNYADSALLATMANQYAKTALFLKYKALSNREDSSKYLTWAQTMQDKSITYTAKVRPKVIAIIEGAQTAESYVPHDAVVGLNQYAAALRYLTANAVEVDDINHTEESARVFTFSSALAQKEVVDLVSFTALLNATTLVVAGNRDAIVVEAAIRPVTSYDTVAASVKTGGVLDRIIKAKNQNETLSSEDLNLDMYGKTNIVSIAMVAPEFATWLEKNGWTESDFDNVTPFLISPDLSEQIKKL